MGAPRILDFGPDQYKERKGVGRVFDEIQDAYKGHQERSAIDEILGEYKQNMGEAQAYEKMQMGLMQDNRIGPTKRLEMQAQLDAVQKTVIEKDKALNAQYKAAQQAESNKRIIRDLEKRNNLPEGELDAYVNDPKMAQKALNPTGKQSISERPIDPEQLKLLEQVRNSEGFNDLDELEQYRALTSAGVSRANAEAESKLKGEQLKRLQTATDKAYDAQKEFIDETTSKYKNFETDLKPKLMQMRNINDEDLVSPTSAVFLEAMGIPLGALEDPSSELYQKLSLDLLKGLPETFGNRILKVEVDNFLKTIPSLLNSPDGRRMIASNMLKLGEMKEVYYNEMRRQQKAANDSGKPLPKDFQQEVFDQVKPQIDRINNEFVKLSEVKSVPKGTVPFFGPDGEIYFVPKDNIQWATENEGRRIW